MLPAILLGAGRVASTVASVAARAGTAAAEVGGTAARAGSAAAEVGGTAARASSALGDAASTASTASRVISGARGVSRGVSQATRPLSNAVHSAADKASSSPPQRGSAYSPSAEPSYGYGAPQRSPQFLNADPHYGVPVGPVHSGYSGLDNAEATTGTVIRRDPPPRPMPLNSSTISTMGRSMAWQAPSTLIGKGAQGSFFEFGGGGSQQGAPYRPQGG